MPVPNISLAGSWARPLRLDSPSGRPEVLVHGDQTVSAVEEAGWLQDHLSPADDADELMPFFLRFRLPADPGRLEPKWEGVRSCHLTRSRALAALLHDSAWSPATPTEVRQQTLDSLLEVVAPDALASKGGEIIARLLEPESQGLDGNLELYLELAREQGKGRPLHEEGAVWAAEDVGLLASLDPELAGPFREFRAASRDGGLTPLWLKAFRHRPAETRELVPRVLELSSRVDGHDSSRSFLFLAGLKVDLVALERNFEWLSEHKEQWFRAAGFARWTEPLERMGRTVALLGSAFSTVSETLDGFAQLGLEANPSQAVLETVNEQLASVAPGHRGEALQECREAVGFLASSLPPEFVPEAFEVLSRARGREQPLPWYATRAAHLYDGLSQGLQARLKRAGSMGADAVVKAVFLCGLSHPRADATEILEGLADSEMDRYNSIWLTRLVEQGAKRLEEGDTVDSLVHKMRQERFLTGVLDGTGQILSALPREATREEVRDLLTLLRLAGLEPSEARDRAATLLADHPGAELLTLVPHEAGFGPATMGGLRELAGTPDGLPQVGDTMLDLVDRGASEQSARQAVIGLLSSGQHERLSYLLTLAESSPTGEELDSFLEQGVAALIAIEPGGLARFDARLQKLRLLGEKNAVVWGGQLREEPSAGQVKVVGDVVHIGSVALKIRPG